MMTHPTRKNNDILYGAFKGMGDLLSAMPVILSELSSGAKIILLIFPQVRAFVELIDFGATREQLTVQLLPVSGGPSFRQFLLNMSQLSPDLVWISPHAPTAASSWRVPAVLWLAKKMFWPRARLAGAKSERLSWLFDQRVAVDRNLPYAEKEWRAFFSLENHEPAAKPISLSFKKSIHEPRLLPPVYDLLIHPGAGAENRKWPREHFAELVKWIPTTYRLAVVGLPSDVEALKAALPQDRGIVYLTGSLEGSITSIARARVVLTMDSGNLHFARVLGVPTVALFGPSSPLTVITPSDLTVPIYEEKWPCQPCGNTRCKQKSVFCMDAIEPHYVAERLMELLAK
jgi:heptosyltransferase-2